MDAELKDKWIAALKSGDYKKGTGLLRDYKNEYCCLGVLCDVIDPRRWQTCPDSFYTYDGHGYYLSPEIAVTVDIASYETKLTELNDTNTSFWPVIEYIEKNL